MKLFDSHCHYEDGMFGPDRFSRLDALKSSEVGVIPTVLDIVNKYDFAYGSVGVHPIGFWKTPKIILK